MIKLDSEKIRLLSMFESVTRTPAKDCIIQKNSLMFIVPEGKVGQAVGKQGAQVRALENALKRKIKIVEFNPAVQIFVKNLVSPLGVNDVTENDGIVTIVPVDHQTRGQLIGRQAQHLRFIEGIVQQYFPIQELRVEKP